MIEKTEFQWTESIHSVMKLKLSIRIIFI